MYIYRCTSFRCAGVSTSNKGPVKIRTDKQLSDQSCPDCGFTMREWKENENTVNFASHNKFMNAPKNKLVNGRERFY